MFRADCVNELLTEATLGPLIKEELPYEKVEYLELNQLWHLDSATSKFTSAGKFGLTGNGIVHPVDARRLFAWKGGNHGGLSGAVTRVGYGLVWSET